MPEQPALTLDCDSLLSTWHRIDARNRDLGWSRYDPGDLDSQPWLDAFAKAGLRLPLRNAVRVAELFAPLSVHRFLRVRKTLVPTAYYHVGMAYLMRERLRLAGSEWSGEEADKVCDGALALRLDAEYNCWAHPYRHHAMAWRRKNASAAPDSCAHHTARLGLLLLEAGKAHGNPEFVSAGVSAACALMEYHTWHEDDDGTATVSYYPDTDDETVNTCAEVAALLASVPSEWDFPRRRERLAGLVRMIAAEQRSDGSWLYCTRRHYERFAGDSRPDNHHSAQNVQALARILCSGSLPQELRKPTADCLSRGLRYYCNAFIGRNDRSSYFPLPGRRPADITGYTEGIAAIAWSLWSGVADGDSDLHSWLISRSASLLRGALRHLDERSCDVASAYRFGRPYHVRSLRWGSGPLMEAILYDCLLSQQLTLVPQSPMEQSCSFHPGYPQVG